jgi:hypothetical protein
VTQAGKENFRRKKKKLNGPPGNFGPDWKRVSFGGNKEKKMGCSRNVGQNRHGLAREEFSKKRSWAAMDTRPNWFWAALRKRKRFWFMEWYSNPNFKYLQTEFELDFKIR